jgi:hypothetical protein
MTTIAQTASASALYSNYIQLCWATQSQDTGAICMHPSAAAEWSRDPEWSSHAAGSVINPAVHSDAQCRWQRLLFIYLLETHAIDEAMTREGCLADWLQEHFCLCACKSTC